MVKLLRRVLSEIRCDLFMRSGEFSSIRRESLLDVITGGELNAPRRISNRGGTSTRGASSMPVSNSKDARVTTNFLLLDPPGLRAPVSLAPTMDRNPARNPWKNVTVSGTRRESTLREPTFIYIHPLLPSCDVPRSLFRFESKVKLRVEIFFCFFWFRTRSFFLRYFIITFYLLVVVAKIPYFSHTFSPFNLFLHLLLQSLCPRQSNKEEFVCYSHCECFLEKFTVVKFLRFKE